MTLHYHHIGDVTDMMPGVYFLEKEQMYLDLKNKVTLAFLVALVGGIVWLNWPAGDPAAEEYYEEDVYVRKTTEEVSEEEMVQRRKQAEEEEDSLTPRRRRTTDIDEPIRRKSKKVTAKEEMVPAV